MQYAGFIGPTNANRSLDVDAERTVNYFPELIDAGTPRVRASLVGVPGYAPFAPLSAGPVRGEIEVDGRCFAVGGGIFSEVLAGGTSVVRGQVEVDGNPATMSANGAAGHQVFITSGGLGYIFDTTTNTFTQITASGFPYPAKMGCFFDGYFCALLDQSNKFYISSPEDGLLWDALDFAQVSESSNQLLAMTADHRELWLQGTKTTEIWYNSGAGNFPFQPISGAFIESGIWAPFSVAKLDNTIMWVAGDERGNGVVMRANGYTPSRISTLAVERYLRSLGRFDNIIAWTYQEAGHLFYVLFSPTPPRAGGADHTSWVYDVSTGLWHERGLYDDRQLKYIPDVGRCHCFAFGKHLVGDRATNTIYEMSDEIYEYRVVLA